MESNRITRSWGLSANWQSKKSYDLLSERMKIVFLLLPWVGGLCFCSIGTWTGFMVYQFFPSFVQFLPVRLCCILFTNTKTKNNKKKLQFEWDSVHFVYRHRLVKMSWRAFWFAAVLVVVVARQIATYTHTITMKQMKKESDEEGNESQETCRRLSTCDK